MSNTSDYDETEWIAFLDSLLCPRPQRTGIPDDAIVIYGMVLTTDPYFDELDQDEDGER